MEVEVRDEPMRVRTTSLVQRNWNLLLRAARAPRCAGEGGELVLGLTEHDATLPKRGRECQRAIFAYSRAARGPVSEVRRAKCGRMGVGRGTLAAERGANGRRETGPARRPRRFRLP